MSRPPRIESNCLVMEAVLEGGRGVVPPSSEPGRIALVWARELVRPPRGWSPPHRGIAEKPQICSCLVMCWGRETKTGLSCLDFLERLEDEGGGRASAGSIADARASAARRAQAAAAALKNIVSV